ncbi:MAG: molecular chaperone Tir [Symploca sp. SIO2B6]|nr:molecular chaperone Tir [Symploca sp. SIO2B6]
MDVHQALSLGDRLLTRVGEKPMNDLERKVFMGSWEGLKYREICPDLKGAENLERNVGFKLWKRLSKSLGEKVTKNQLKGAFARATEVEARVPQSHRIFISYLKQPSDYSIATRLYEVLKSQGYLPILSSLDAIASSAHQLGETDEFRRTCDCFILLASDFVTRSEIAIEELRQLRHWRSEKGATVPTLVTVLINTQFSHFSHDLRHSLRGSCIYPWSSQEDTPILLNKIHGLLNQSSNQSPLEEQDEDDPPSGIYPLPTAEPTIPLGLVRLASTFYVEREPCESECYSAIQQPGALIRIKAPRQMGKTSLMARILEHARKQGCRAVPLSFQHADRNTFDDLGTFLRWFCMKVAHKLRLPHRLDEFWVDTFGSKDNCSYYFTDYLLPEIREPLVLGLDEVDCVFQYPEIADDFFGLLRAWYEEASYGSDDSELWEKLRLVVVHSTEVYIPLDVNQSPFNVGLPIELRELTPTQVSDLAYRHNLDWTGEQVKTLMTLVGGHPYLIRLALYYIAKQQITLDELCEMAPTESGIYDDHLRRHFWHLNQHPELAVAYHAVLKSDHPVELDSEQAFKLHSLGLVHFKRNGVVPSFDLYRQYFGDRLQPPLPTPSSPPLNPEHSLSSTLEL